MLKPEDVKPINDIGDIILSASAWSESRNINKAPFSWIDLAGNLLEEVEECILAQRELMNFEWYLRNTDYIGLEEHDKKKRKELIADILDAIFDSIIHACVDYDKDESTSSKNGINYGLILDKIDDKTRAQIRPFNDAYYIMSNGLENFISMKISLAMDVANVDEDTVFKMIEETFKEISCRRGKYSEKAGKWLKEPKGDNYYEANYVKFLKDI